jgi:predicted porin
VNTGYEYSKETVTTANGKTTTKKTGFQNDQVKSSRLGFKGEEALGNGLSATFALEMGFDAANGEFKTTKDKEGNKIATFNRKATVGLKGAFGEVRIGKDSTPMNEFDGSFKAIDRTTTLAKQVAGRDASWEGRPTGLFYNGTFSGVSVSAAIGNNSERTKTGGVTTKKDDSAVYGLGLGYNGGAWAVGAAVQLDTEKTLSGDVKTTNYGVGASYDFNVAKVYGQYEGGQYKNKASTVADKYSYDQFAVGVSAPFGATTLSAEYAYNKAKDTAGAVSTKYKGNVFAVQAEYAFSKRTSLVARAGQVANWKNKTTNDKSSTQEYTVGLRHKF